MARSAGKGGTHGLKKGSDFIPVAGLNVDILSDLTQTSYIELVRWTGLQAYPNKRGKLSAAKEAPPDEHWKVARHPREWMHRIQGTESRYYRAIGSVEALSQRTKMGLI